LGNVLEQAQLQQDELDTKRQAVMLDTKLDELKQEVRAEPDYGKRESLYQTKAAEYMAQVSSAIESGRVKKGINQYYQLQFPKELLKFRSENQKEWGLDRVAQAESLGDILAEKIVNTDDPREEQKYKQLFNAQIEQLSTGPYAPLNKLQAERKIKEFETKSLELLATKIVRGNPDAMHKPEILNRLAPLGEAKLLEWQSKARKASEEIDNSNERVIRKNKAVVKDAAEAQANFGKLDPAWLDNAMAGNNPLISPADARHLKSVNDNPPTGGGGGAAAVIWDQYLSGPRTLPRIERARAELNRLSKELGSPSKDILKYKNELQTDQTTIENQGIARESNQIQRENRAVRDAQTVFDATEIPQPKVIERIFGNQDKRNRALIDLETRLNGPEAGKKLAQELGQGKKTKADAIEKKHGKALNYDGG
jgi:hypothetical protein